MRYKIYEIQFTDEAAKQFNAFPSKLRRQIENKLEKIIARDPYLGKPLQGTLKSLFSYRLGKLRIIYKIDKNRIVVIVVNISYRKEVYR